MNLPDFLNQLRNPNPTSIFHGGNGSYILFKDITLTQCQFFQEIKIDHGIMFSNVIFEGVTFKKLVTNGFVVFKNCKSVEKTFSDFTIESPFNITLIDNVFAEDVLFRNCSCQSFALIRCSFFKQLTFFGGEIKYFEILDDCEIKNIIYFKDIIIPEIHLKGGIINRILFESGTFTTLKLLEKITVNELNIKGGHFEYIKFDEAQISNVLIYSREEKIKGEIIGIKVIEFNRIIKGFFNFKTCKIKTIKFQFSYSSRDTIFRFNDLDLENLNFKNYVNYGQINLNGVTVNNSLQLINSDLGKFSLIGCNMNEADITFKRSKILETFIVGGEFSKKFKNSNSDDTLDAYSQIKKIYENRGSQKDALEYYSLEMNALDKTYNWFSHPWEKLNFLLNRLSTNHGLSWKRGFLSTLFVCILFFAAYVSSLKWTEIYFQQSINWPKVLDISSHFFDFINPTHKTDIVAEKLNIIPNPFSRIIEGLSRIFIAYFIYQLIQAFRKHGKK